MKAAFTGYYGMGNYGDDLFGVLCAAAGRRFWNCDPVLVGPRVPDAKCDSTMPAGYSAPRYGAGGLYAKTIRLYSFSKAVLQADVLVLGGGSVISRETIRKPIMKMAHRARHLRLAAVGVSVGPFMNSASRAAAAGMLAQFDYLSVRDERSYKSAVDLGFEVGRITHKGRDLAGLLPLVAPLDAGGSDHGGRPLRLGFAPCNYMDADDGSIPECAATQTALLHALERLAAQTRLEVDVFSLNEHGVHGDAALADDFHFRLQDLRIPGRRVRYVLGPLAMAREIGHCDAFVSGRLHGAITAYMYGVPTALIEYHQKCRDFAEDVGLPEARRISAGHSDAAAFDQALASMINRTASPALANTAYARQGEDIFRCAPWSVA